MEQLPNSFYRFGSPISQIHCFSKLWDYINELVHTGLQQPSIGALEQETLVDWGEQQTVEILSSVSIATENDGVGICQILGLFGDSVVEL